MSSKNDIDEATKIIHRGLLFKQTSYQILSTHESSSARAITIEDTYKQLKQLSVKQDELLRQSIRCIETSLFRASHVLAWAALMDFIEEKISLDGFVGVNSIRPKWNIKTTEELRDIGSDFQLLEVLKELGFCTKTEEKALKGLLNKRNECAHPTDYFPGLNESLGYVSEILRRLANFQMKWK